MGKIFVMDHPLIAHKVTMLRNKDTSVKDFRELVYEIAILMGYEATKDLKTVETKVETPLMETTGRMIQRQVALVPILRAGLGMVDAMMRIIPAAKVGHIGLYRDIRRRHKHRDLPRESVLRRRSSYEQPESRYF